MTLLSTPHQLPNGCSYGEKQVKHYVVRYKCSLIHANVMELIVNRDSYSSPNSSKYIYEGSKKPYLSTLFVENGAVSTLISMHILVNLHKIIGREVLIQLWMLIEKKRELLFAASAVDKNAILFNDIILDYMLNHINIFPSVL